MPSPTSAAPRRYALVGTGHRAEMYTQALIGSHTDVGELVALLDVNPTRIAYHQRLRRDAGASGDLPVFDADGFEDMLREVRPDVVVVTTVDATHARYVVAALERDVDVIVEKPLTTDEDGVRSIVAAAQASRAHLAVTFNYRYSPRNSAVKELLSQGAVGEVTSLTFEWVLDTVHGADYFRRWHRDKSRSGGLFVHKASHHFDLVNWWLDDAPQTVVAMGGLRFYGDDNARSRGLGERPARSHGAAGTADDPFSLDLTSSPRLTQLYLDAEADDGYVRDQDVFSPGVTIEDNLTALVRYSGGAVLTYALNAHSPWEGYRVAVNGTEGRLELEVVERSTVAGRDAGTVVGQPRPAVDPSATPEQAVPDPSLVRPVGTRLVVQRHWEPARAVDVVEDATAHGGGDARMLDDLFRPGASEDPLHRAAGYRDGARSVLVGIAANRSLETGLPVDVSDLCPALDAGAPDRTLTTTGGRTP